jgi:hypothetical protein
MADTSQILNNKNNGLTAKQTTDKTGAGIHRL